MTDGGLRCAAHTRGPYLKARVGTPEWDEAAGAYAATPEGQAEVRERLGVAVMLGRVQEEAACRAALAAGERRREVAGVTRALVRRTGEGSETGPEVGGVPVVVNGLPVAAPTTPEGCLAIATAAHGSQMYGNRPYVEAHVEPVGRLLAPYGAHAEMVGYLHDVVEDTAVSLDDLAAAGAPVEVVAGVDGMTKRPGESKETAAVRARDTSRLSRLGKLADNTANRLGLDGLAEREPERAARLRVKYERVRAILVSEADGSTNREFEEIAAALEAAWRNR